jgi:hypothetical protein
MNLKERYSVRSNPLKTERRVELVALVMLAILLLQLIYSGLRLALLTSPQAIAPAPDTLVVGDVASALKLSAADSEELLGRPLFWPSRRPALEEVEKAPPPEEEKSGDLKGVKLVGVFGVGESAGIIALVKDKKQRILLGEKVLGWTLQSVEPTRIVLVDKGSRREMSLEPGKGAGVKEDASGASKKRKR